MELEEIVVTGSHIRTTDQGSLPIQTITQEQIESSGAATVEQLLQAVSVAVQGNSNIVASTASGATTGGVSSISLRGLGSQRTLVLLNGRRLAAGGNFADSATVDVNSIAVSALERVDVLKEGASAVYGSDAIAGVVNFIIRDNYQGAQITGYGGDTSDGGGDIKRVSGVLGFGDLYADRYNVLVTGSFQKESGLAGRDRDFARSSINLAALNDTTSGSTFPANFSAADGSFATRNPLAGNCAPSLTDPLNNPDTRCRFDTAPYVALLPDAQRYNVYAAARRMLSDDSQLYAEASFNHSRQRYQIQPISVSSSVPLASTNPLANTDPYDGVARILLRPSSPYYPTAFVDSITGDTSRPDLDVFFRSIVTGNRDLTNTSEQPRAVLGVKGSAAGWNYDASLLYSQTRQTEHTNNGFPLYSKLLPLLNSGQVNFFGPSTPEAQALVDATQFRGDTYQTKSTLVEAAASVSRELMELPDGPLAVAFGTEFRKEKFTVDPIALLQQGDITGYGANFVPQRVQRDVYGAFAEINVPIVETLEGGVAVRYDHYEGTGGKTTPQAKLRWKPFEQLLLRTSYGKGFRAPSLTELFQAQVLGATQSSLSDPTRCPTTGSEIDCNTQFPALIGGNTNLDPEESDNYTLGFVVAPTDDISFAVDGFSIELQDTITFGVPPSTILADLNTYGHLITRGAPTPDCPRCPGPITSIDQRNANFGETNVAGYDADLRWRVPTDAAGTFTLGLVGTYLAKYDVQNPDGTFSRVVGKVSGIVNGNGGVVPRWHHYLTGTWSLGAWDVSVSQNFQSSYTDLIGTHEDASAPGFKPREVDSYSTVDFQMAYSGLERVRMAIGLRNAFNTDPPYTNAGGQNSLQAGYDPGYVDPRGRFIYGTVTYSFAQRD